MVTYVEKLKMKKYYQYYLDISEDALFEGLLGYGMFSDRLPPIFSSADFFEKSSKIEQYLQSDKKCHDYLSFNVLRNTGDYRTINIPNPIAYYHLCCFLRENWNKIQNYFKATTNDQDSNISQIHLQYRKNKKSLFEMKSYESKYELATEDSLIVGKKYCVTADISSCFPSIYTHAIPWALIGKNKAKKERSNGYWYNGLDKWCRNVTNGETHGILIGPHYSNLISEIVLTKIDQKIMSDKWQFVRYIDDFHCYTKNENDANAFLIQLYKALQEFGLTLNRKKISITRLPQINKDAWISVLNSDEIVENKKITSCRKLKAFFDKTLKLLTENDDNIAILNYAIKIISSKKMGSKVEKYFIEYVFHLIFIYPYLITILNKCVLKKYEISQIKLEKYISLLYSEGREQGNIEEQCYAIYYAIIYNLHIIPLENLVKSVQVEMSKELDEDNNGILNLLIWCYFKNKKQNDVVETIEDYAATLVNERGGNIDDNWLFLYEILPKNKLKQPYRTMKDESISFLSPELKKYIDNIGT